MIQECLEDQGNLVQEIGRPGEEQEFQGGLLSLERSRNVLEVKSTLT